ncbi:MAG: protein kinase, partial [Rhodothermales bacterium]|nr:protein kinase [Rhodothermales bacterium]
MNPGTIISHYRVVGQLGQGGMGIVYKAEDTKLDRTVALKLLPPHALASEDDRARFYREARAAAALNHPNIAHVYEIDESDVEGEAKRPFIAMEYIDGESLAERVAKGPLPLQDAISIATQVADGLKAAHEKNIVHRDVKSGNIMLTSAGVPKILDFGLAKTAASTKLTQMGSTLGTVAYMSPEQARGEEVDRRSDVWSLGVILYEMVSGQMPFLGDYEQATIYGILNAEPEPLTAVRTGVSMEIERIVSKCLTKDAELRYGSAADLIVDLRRVATSQSSATFAASSATTRLSGTAPSAVSGVDAPGSVVQPVAKDGSRSWLWLVPGLILGFALAWVLIGRGDEGRAEPFRKLTLHFEGLQWIRHTAMSPDGRYLALDAADTSGTHGIFLHDLSEGTTRLIEDTFDKDYPFFSPDGSRLVIEAQNGSSIYLISIPNGLPVSVVANGGMPAWESNESIIFERAGDAYRKNLTDGTEEFVARADTLPGREQFIYIGEILREQKTLISSRQYASGTNADLITIDLTSGEWRILEPAAINGWYVKDGFLVYQLGTDSGRMVVRPFDAGTQRFTGPPMDLLPETEWFRVRTTPDGDLLYVPDPPPRPASRLEWLNPDGRRELAVELNDNIWGLPALSPDGRSVLISETTSLTSWEVPLLRVDLRTGVREPISSHSINSLPTWMPDGDAYFFATGWFGWGEQSIVKQFNGELSTDEVVIKGGSHPSVSSDGRWLLYIEVEENSGPNLFALDLSSRDTVSIEQGLDSAAFPALSPDGRFVVYSVQEVGGSEIRIIPFRGGSARTVATKAGQMALWSRDGSSLLYIKSGNVVRLPVD